MSISFRDSRLMREAARPRSGLDPKDESGGARSAIAQHLVPALLDPKGLGMFGLIIGWGIWI